MILAAATTCFGENPPKKFKLNSPTLQYRYSTGSQHKTSGWYNPRQQVLPPRQLHYRNSFYRNTVNPYRNRQTYRVW